MQARRPSPPRRGLAAAIVETARRRAGDGRLGRGRRQGVELPAGAEAGVADLALDRQEAAGERRVRPVRRQRDPGAVGDRRERELARADELDPDFGAQRPAGAGERLGDVGVKAARMGGVPGAGEHRRGDAVDLHRRAAHAARVAQGDEQHRRIAVQARAGMSRFGNQRCAVVPGGDQARLQHVAVDLEDASVARLDRDVALDVERRRGRAQLEVVPLGDRFPVLALALDRLPALAAVALDHRTDQRLRRRQAGGDAALGFAQSSFSFGDDAAHRLERDRQGDEDGRQGERLGEQGKTSGCHGCAFFDGLRRDVRRGRDDRPRPRRKCESAAVDPAPSVKRR